MNDHPTDLELRQFADGSLAPDRVVALGDHLEACAACRARGAAIGRAGDRLAELSADVLALTDHLTEDEIEAYATGAAGPDRSRLGRHLAECPACAREVDDLRKWAATRSPGRRRLYLAAAAAIILLAIVPTFISRWSGGNQQSGQETLAGLDLLPVEYAANVRAALSAGVAAPPAWIGEESNRTETLMGGAPQPAFQLTAPVRTTTVSDRPEFRWTTVPGATVYTIAVFDTKLQPAADPATVRGTTWTPPQPLARGTSYLWQVTAQRGTETLTVPAPPQPPVTFRVMDRATADTLERVVRSEPASHLLLGILYAQAGARSDAEIHLRQVAPSDPHAGVARRTLEAVRNPR